MVEALWEAGSVLVDPVVILYVILGSAVGLVFGALPGLGGVVALSVMLPFTFGMEQVPAMLFLAAIMGGVPFGGSISAILLNTPGTPPNAATCFDGHPMARAGEGNKAIGIAATSSALGAIFGLAVLVLAMPLVRRIVLLFGPPEFFMLVVFGLVLVALATRGNMIRGLAAGGVGILISLVGYSEVFGTLRFTGGTEYLWDGIQLVPFVIGIFAVSELLNYAIRGGKIATKPVPSDDSPWDGVKAVWKHKRTFFRSSAVGTGIGIIPAVGGVVANFVAYTMAKRASKTPESFGTGNPDGVVAPEAANNAKDGGALLPTVGFGIPGSPEMAVLLGGLVLHGLNPGPFLVKDHMEIVFALVLGLLISNIIAAFSGLMLRNYIAKLAFINVSYIIPVVLVLCFVGAYTLRSNIWDVGLVIIFGLVGYGFSRYGFPNISLIIGFVLGILAERAFYQSLQISDGDYTIFVTEPISLVLVILLVAVFLLPAAKRRLGKGR